MSRKCENWLNTLTQYVEDTESPRHFWFWGGLVTLTSALQRKVWVPFGLEPIYPNLYVILVAPPGRCRKGAPLSLSRKLLHEAKVRTSVDSTTKRAFTKELEKIGKSMYFEYEGLMCPNTSMCIVSKELSSLLAIDPKSMIELLTDLYDSHDQWAYKTSGEGQDFLYGLCINLLGATTPTWIAANLPEEAIGGGFTSRLALIHGEKKYKRVTIPREPPTELFKDLVRDLSHIKTLTGEFRWGDDGAFEIFDMWYQGLGKVRRATPNEKLHSFIERMHIMVLKVAMALRVSYSDNLTFTRSDIEYAIGTLDGVLREAGKVFAGHGRSKNAIDNFKVLNQVNTMKRVSFRELLQWNMNNTNKTELEEIIQTLEGAGTIKVVWASQPGQDTMIHSTVPSKVSMKGEIKR